MPAVPRCACSAVCACCTVPAVLRCTLQRPWLLHAAWGGRGSRPAVLDSCRAVGRGGKQARRSPPVLPTPGFEPFFCLHCLLLQGITIPAGECFRLFAALLA